MGKNGRNKLNWKAILVVLGILGIFAGMIVYLDWAWDIYGLDYALSVASLFVATVVGLAVIYTLKLTKKSLEMTRATTKVTKESLEMTRATTRPFLDVSVPDCIITRRIIISSGMKYWTLDLRICNTGNLPADKVDIMCTFCTIENKTVVKEYELSVDKTAPSIYFPGDKLGPSYKWDNTDYDFEKEDIRQKTLIRVTIDYRNRLIKETGTTNRYFSTRINTERPQDHLYLDLIPSPTGRIWQDSWR